MSTGNSGAVFILGSRAHYQVLQQPEVSPYEYDIENGNASTETIYRNQSEEQDGDENNGGGYFRSRRDECNSEITLLESEDGDFDFGGTAGGVTKRRFRRLDETQERLDNDSIDIDPASLNNCDMGSPKAKMRSHSRRCMNLMALLVNLRVRRKRKLSMETVDYHDNLKNALAMCTYKDSCRCLDCQGRYFECDESNSEYSESESEDYPLPSAVHRESPVQSAAQCDFDADCDENEEVFVDIVPPDNTSTEILLDNKEKNMSVSSSECTVGEIEGDEMQIEMAAGTPVVLDYLLNHPFTCAIM